MKLHDSRLTRIRGRTASGVQDVTCTQVYHDSRDCQAVSGNPSQVFLIGWSVIDYGRSACSRLLLELPRMLDSFTLAFLATDSGEELIRRAASLEGSLLSCLTRLRRECSPELAAAALETVELRRRAAGKFAHPDAMLFTRVGLEQSTGEVAAAHRAARFPRGGVILDICCGIGGDAAQLARRGSVLAVDKSPACAICCRHNAGTRAGSESVAVACAAVESLRLRADEALFDPSRRAEGARVKRSHRYSPPLQFLEVIRRSIPNLAVKVSPALDDRVLDSFGSRVEFVSVHGECREAVLWFGEIGPGSDRSAAVLPAGATLEQRDCPTPALSKPLSWLFEPDSAVARAHLIHEMAAEISGYQIDPRISWLTSDHPPDSPLGTSLRVVEAMQFSVNRIQERLGRLGARAVAVKRRGVPFIPEEIQRQLKSGGDRPIVVVLTRVSGSPTAILCDPPASWGGYTVRGAQGARPAAWESI